MDVSLFWRLYDALPIPPSLFRRILPAIVPFLNLRIPLCWYSGKSGRPRVLVAGDEEWISYLLDRIFPEGSNRRSLGLHPLWSLNALLRRNREKADLVIIRLDRVSQRLLGNEYIVVPEWVGTCLPLPVQLEELERRNESLRTNLRLIRRARLEVRESGNCDLDFEEFYYQMYVPFIRARHGEEAVLKDFHQLRKSFRTGGLLILYQESRRLGGMLYSREKNRLLSVALGAVPGEENWMRSGGNTALIREVIRRGLRQGFREVDFGGCRPFLNDGLLSYKRRWGMQVCRRQSTYFNILLYWTGFNELVHSFLFENPLIVDSNGGFVGLTAEPLPAFLRNGMSGPGLTSQDGIERVFAVRLKDTLPLSKGKMKGGLVSLPISDRNSGSSAQVKKFMRASLSVEGTELSHE